MRIVDTHLHLWDLERLPYSWTGGIACLARSFGVEEYRVQIAGTGISKSIFMECDVDDPHSLAEAQWAQEIAERDPLVAGIVASCRPERTDFAEQLEGLLALSKVRGVRRVLHTQADGLSETALFRENLSRLARHGLSFDLCALARQLPVAIELVKACPEVSFLIDHCGVPDVKGGVFEPWRGCLRELAELENVVACKVSGIVAYADAGSWTVDTLRPWFEQVVERFGWDRLVWGGDWPVCTLSATLPRWVEASRSLMEAASETERAKLFYLNAERIYRV